MISDETIKLLNVITPFVTPLIPFVIRFFQKKKEYSRLGNLKPDVKNLKPNFTKPSKRKPKRKSLNQKIKKKITKSTTIIYK
ncbi:MAG TPA: hypothetical protein VJY62_21315 [Bacteroidia bacterium]|nr:hypothetical protein [Bacteroidia bacterium]